MTATPSRFVVILLGVVLIGAASATPRQDHIVAALHYRYPYAICAGLCVHEDIAIAADGLVQSRVAPADATLRWGRTQRQQLTANQLATLVDALRSIPDEPTRCIDDVLKAEIAWPWVIEFTTPGPLRQRICSQDGIARINQALQQAGTGLAAKSIVRPSGTN